MGVPPGQAPVAADQLSDPLKDGLTSRNVHINSPTGSWYDFWGLTHDEKQEGYFERRAHERENTPRPKDQAQRQGKSCNNRG